MPKVDRARAVLRRPKRTDSTKVSLTRTTVKAMQAAPTWSGSPELQAAAKRWGASADALEKNGTFINNLKTQLGVAQAAQRANRRDWEAATLHVSAAVTSVAAGDKSVVTQNGFDIQTRSASGVDAPEITSSGPGKALGEATFAWACPTARNGYLVQTARDTQDATTYSQVIPCTRRSMTLRGLDSRQVVHVRVAAIDPTETSGIGAWTKWIAVNAR